MKTRDGFGCMLGVLVLLAARNLQAAPERFGDKGQIVIDERFKLAGTYDRTEVLPQVVFSNKTLVLAPAASYFVLQNVSLGLQISFAHHAFEAQDNAKDQSAFRGENTQLGVAPSVGYAVPLTDQLTLWPQLGIQYTKRWASGPIAFDGLPNTGSWLSFKAALPLLWSPATHFFVGIGPQAAYESAPLGEDYYESGKLELGVSSLIGGNFTL